VQLYEPLIGHWCARAGLQSADTADIGQDVLLAVSNNLADFRKEIANGAFRGWLWTTTQNKITDFWRRRGRQASAEGGSDAQRRLLQCAAAESALSESDALDETRILYQQALTLIQREFEERTWQAFYRVVVNEESPIDVASQLGMSPGAVYIAKSRVLARLRSEFAGVLIS
jgi:RNA polymerase sigma-70 factor (ECF subfamily)